MTTNQENLDTEKLTETAATRRGCVTPTTLPSAVQPASARYCKQILRTEIYWLCCDYSKVLVLHTMCVFLVLTLTDA